MAEQNRQKLPTVSPISMKGQKKAFTFDRGFVYYASFVAGA
jgi:hypothetical protein